jgi:hypothetical protein
LSPPPGNLRETKETGFTILMSLEVFGCRSPHSTQTSAMPNSHDFVGIWRMRAGPDTAETIVKIEPVRVRGDKAVLTVAGYSLMPPLSNSKGWSGCQFIRPQAARFDGKSLYFNLYGGDSDARPPAFGITLGAYFRADPVAGSVKFSYFRASDIDSPDEMPGERLGSVVGDAEYDCFPYSQADEFTHRVRDGAIALPEGSIRSPN